MLKRKIICITFVGDVQRDSRLRRFATTLAREWPVTIISLGESAKRYSFSGVDVLQLQQKSSSLKRSLPSFWREGARKAAATGAAVFLASDLYSLPAASRAARSGGGLGSLHAVLMYDSRELYSDIAALRNRPMMQWFWSALESRHARDANVIFTVNDSIADILRGRYRQSVIKVLHNYPDWKMRTRTNVLREQLGIARERIILLSQGGIQEGRGALLYVKALTLLPGCELVFLGSGDMKKTIAHAARQEGVSGHVHFVDAVPSTDLPVYTASADIGLCVPENLGQSYFLSLPNKLFEYISAGLPVVGSDFPEIASVVHEWHVGLTADPADPGTIALAVRRLIDDSEMYERMTQRCRAAAEVLNWEKESSALTEIVSEAIG